MLSLSVVGANLSASESDPRLQQLSDFIELKIGAGEGKRPLVVLLPGCLGWHPHHAMWQKRLLQSGYATLHVDTFKAESLETRAQLQREVCSGKRLHGQVRAADLMVALSSFQGNETIDTSQTILLGWSHGAWSAFEFLVRSYSGSVSSTLSKFPQLDHVTVKGAFLFYPYCGPGSLDGSTGYPKHVRTLFIHGQKDVITSPSLCRARVNRLRRQGNDVEFMMIRDARHWFDNHAEPSVYDRAATEKVRSLIEQRLSEIFEF